MIPTAWAQMLGIAPSNDLFTPRKGTTVPTGHYRVSRACNIVDAKYLVSHRIGQVYPAFL